MEGNMLLGGNADNGALQALAAVGQCRLMSLWDNLFSHLRVPVAQILLTRNDIADVRCKPLLSMHGLSLTLKQRTQYINAQNTFEQLFEMGVVPIVNENDTLAVSVWTSLRQLEKNPV
jgi:glutamate 5-kinase